MESFGDANVKKTLSPEFGLPVVLLREGGGGGRPGCHHVGVTPFHDTN